MSLGPEPTNTLLWLLSEAQQGLWRLLGALGVTDTVHGQPAWPFAHRLAAEQLLFDPGQVKRLWWLGAVALALLVFAAVGLCWRRARWPLVGLGGWLLATLPWPEWQLLRVPTPPTAFHRPDHPFEAGAIVRGQALYQAQCQRCHGDDGRGEGPDAARLAMWPPTLNGSLLWKRLDGELFWRVRHGMLDRQGQATMPGTGDSWSDAQVWDVLAFVRAQAAGQTLRATGAWVFPVPVPDATVSCRGTPRALSSLRGQRLHLVAAGGPFPAADPRLLTVSVGAASADADCQASSPELAQALATVLGVGREALPGHQLLADRDGWLRVRGQPGAAAWSEDDLVCRTAALKPASDASAADGLEALIRRMDAEPVRDTRGGFPH